MSDSLVSPIERLPPELLQKILAQIGEGFERFFLGELLEEDIAYLPYTDILDLLLISKRWYNAAIVVPELWTCLPTHAPSEIIDTFTRRSGERPLYLFIDCTRGNWTPRSAEKQRQLLSMLPRVKGFLWKRTDHASDIDEDEPAPEADNRSALCLSTAEIYTILSTVEAPLLQELYLNLEEVEQDEDAFLPALFAGIPPPRLRCLQVHNRSIPTSNPLLQCPLTHLHLPDAYDMWRNGSDMATTLARLPSLEVLELGAPSGLSAFTFEQSSTTPQHEQIVIASLPRLSSFEVQDEITSIAIMLKHLSLPLTCLMKIEARGAHGGDAPVDDVTKSRMIWTLYTALNAHYKPAIENGMSFRAAHALLRDRRDDRLWMQASHLCRPEDSPFSQDRVDLTDPDLVHGQVVKNTQLTLGIVWDLPDVPAVSTARILFEKLFVLQELEGLSLSTPSSMRSPQNLPEFLARFPRFDAIIAGQSRIRWLEMTHYPACAFARMSESTASLLYPQLEVICVKNAALTPVPVGDLKQSVPETLDVARLESYLSTRARSGHLRKFHVRKCIIDDSALVQRLKHAVGEDVWTWDGKIMGWW